MSEKYYQLGTYTPEQWCEIHTELTEETNEVQNIPNRCITCHDEKPHSPTRGTFLLTDQEANLLKNDPRIKFINEDFSMYPETYKAPPEDIQATNAELLNRWQGTVKIYREFETSNTLPANPNITDINRTGFQLLRPMQKLDPWVDGETSSGGSFDSWPENWIKDSETLVAFVSFQSPSWEYLVTVNGPTTLSVLLDAAGSSVYSTNATCSIEIEILDSSNNQIQLYTDASGPGTDINPIINQSNVSLPNSETYKIYYRSTVTYNTGSESDFLWAVGANCNLSTVASSSNTVLERNILQFNDGRDVDVIVADDGGGWIGHPEFQNNCTGPKPFGYVGGNVLPGNGTCDVLDLVLDSPYYLDPEYFDENPNARLTTRWDGTKVPIESVARNWWSSTSSRSSSFNNRHPNVGTVFITSGYTRTYCNGSNTSQSAVGQHCTPCMALAYGRTQGWAYNSNKWVFNLYGSNGTDIEQGIDIQKIFHLTKPINVKYQTKNPTISSNSWGYRASKGTVNGYYHFRSDGPVQYPGTSSEPAFISHMGLTGDVGRWKSEMKINSYTVALDELIDSGVIFVAAAGNSNQKQVGSNHPDWGNYISATPSQTLEQTTYFEFGIATTGSTNRRGFPQQGGMYTDEITGERIYPVINVGALNDNFKSGKECKVNYSDRGEQIDVYFPADGTLAANMSYAPEGRYPDTYPGFTANSGSGVGVPEDCAFGGTSAACPVAAGFIACLVGLNRNWTWKEVKQYFNNLEAQDQSRFYYGVESLTAGSANWTDYEGLEGGVARVGYANNVGQSTFPIRKSRISNGLNVKGVKINYIQKFDRG